jgi:hypothetical protein
VIGVPFGHIAGCFGFAAREVIDAEYHGLASDYLRRKAALKQASRREQPTPVACFDGVSS